jgi:hypothetical protein
VSAPGRRIRAVTIAALTACMALVACDESPDGGPVEGRGYGAELPSGWEDGGTGGLVGEEVEEQTGAEVESVWIRHDRDDGFRANIGVTFEDVAPGSTALQLARQSLRELSRDVGVPEGLNDLVNVTPLTDVVETTLGGEPAATFDYLNEVEQGELRQRSIIVVRGSRAVIVTATARDEVFDEREPEFEEILGSWKWEPRK